MIRVLQICLRVPYPPVDGGTIAMYTMANSLRSAGAEVKMVALNTHKHFIDPANLPPDFIQFYKPEMVYVDATVKVIPAFLNLFSEQSYNINRFDVPLMHEELKRILVDNNFDVIQLESLFMSPYIKTIRKHSSAKVVLRAHNVEYLIWERLAESAANPVKKWYLNFLAKKLKRYECSVFNNFDGVIALTGDDSDLIKSSGCKVPVFVSPIGLNTNDYDQSLCIPGNRSVFHLGSMDWLPNIEAVDWFIDKVLPLLDFHSKGLTIFIAGKGMPDRYFKLNDKNLVVSGRIDDARGFMFDKQIMIVPLLSGGGMRVKIIEGMAMGKTIISTSIGAEGIQYTHEKNIIIADTPQDFSNAILKCIADPDYCVTIGKNARTLAKENYDIKIIGSGILNFYTSLIQAKNKNLQSVSN